MSLVENTITTGIVLLAPVALIYGWFFVARRAGESPRWRNRISVASLALISSVCFLWPVMMGLAPGGDWSTGIGVGEQIRWIEAWHKPILRTLLAALVLGLFGRPRLIVPIMIACVGVSVFWIIGTIP